MAYGYVYFSCICSSSLISIYSKYMAGELSLEECDRESWLAPPPAVAYELAPRLFKAIKGVDQ